MPAVNPISSRARTGDPMRLRTSVAWLRGAYRIGWDAGNGASGPVIEKLTKLLPGEHHLLFTDVDGNFPNHHPDPTEEKNLAHLKTLKGAAFDQAYVDHEVAYHQQVIEALDNTLIPGATNEELRALLIKVRPAFVAHLEHAKMLQASMRGHK